MEDRVESAFEGITNGVVESAFGDALNFDTEGTIDRGLVGTVEIGS